MPSGQAMVATPGGFVGFSTWEVEVGGRYFLATGKTQYNLYGAPAGINSDQVSRLTYDSLTSHSGELFGRVDHATGFFAKGFIGGGIISGGTLQDEDFPPLTVPYSSTQSDLHDGKIAYGAIDLGWAWRTDDFSLGFFVGYFHYFERLNAFGCTQTAGNPDICSNPSIPSSVQTFSQETNWDAARLGINTMWKVGRWSVTAEAAWLPYVSLNAKDTHFGRIAGLSCDPAVSFCDLSGPLPQTATDAMTSVQLEAILSYQVTPALSLGLGGRYWNIHTQKGGNLHFEVAEILPGFGPQAIDFKTERWGVFFQASYKFGQPNSFPGAWY
jgi:hypothetical protein